MELPRLTDGEIEGYLHPELHLSVRPSDILSGRIRTQEIESASEILRCEGRTIFRLPAGLDGTPCSCYLYFFTNRSWNRALRRTSAFHIMQISSRLRHAGFPGIEVLAALKPRSQLLNWKSLLIAMEIENVQELPSAGSHVYQVHGTASLGAELLRSVACHIAAFHNAGFIHGDLKSRHVLVRQNLDGHEVFLVDLEKTRRIPAGLHPAHDVWATRDLIQLFASLPQGLKLKQEQTVSNLFLDSYFERRRLGSSRVKRIRRWLQLYEPGGRLKQGRTLLSSLLKPWRRSVAGLPERGAPPVKDVQSDGRRHRSPTS